MQAVYFTVVTVNVQIMTCSCDWTT